RNICSGKARLIRLVAPASELIIIGLRNHTLVGQQSDRDSLAVSSIRGAQMRDRGSFWPEARGPAAHTVATALAGEPTAPGRRNGGAVSRKRERPLARSQSARSDNSQISPR